MSERITWERCPGCGDTAAVGWAGERPVEIDCLQGCVVPLGCLTEAVGQPAPGRSRP
ncbi:hypothetical protein [Blastococcus sp. SYSU D00813]